MTDASSHGGFADPPLDTAQTLRAVRTAVARPGALVPVPGAYPPAPLSQAAGALILALIDADSPVHLGGAADNPAVRAWIAEKCGAPVVSAETCRFGIGTWPALWPVSRFPPGKVGSAETGAHLVVEMPELKRAGPRLVGTAVDAGARLNLPEIEAFAENAARFPLGVHFFFCAGRTVAAVPPGVSAEIDPEDG